MVMKFKMGDRVRKKANCAIYANVPHGLVGTIVGFFSPAWHVEWDEDVVGHSCDGKAKQGFGYNLMEYHLEHAKIIIDKEGNIW